MISYPATTFVAVRSTDPRLVSAAVNTVMMLTIAGIIHPQGDRGLRAERGSLALEHNKLNVV